MENLKIRFTPMQLGSFCRLLNLQFVRTFKKLDHENYIEYYNLRTTLKKCFDKIFSLDKKKLKVISLALNPNEIRACKMIFSINNFLDLPAYELVIVNDFFMQVDKYETDLIFESRVLKDDIGFRVSDTGFGKMVAETQREYGY